MIQCYIYNESDELVEQLKVADQDSYDALERFVEGQGYALTKDPK